MELYYPALTYNVIQANLPLVDSSCLYCDLRVVLSLCRVQKTIVTDILQELDMINLFGSPAGRAITEPKPTKTFSTDNQPNLTGIKDQQHKHPDDMQLQSGQPRRHLHQILPQPHLQQSNNRSPSIDSLQPQHTHRLALYQQQNDIKFSSPNVDESKKSLIFKSNVTSKKGKFWKFLEEGKNCQKNSLEDLSTSSSGKSR